jgi:phosphomannomutase/phosphoglucomutase
VRNGLLAQRDADKVLLGILDSLGDSRSDFVGFSKPVAHDAVFVAAKLVEALSWDEDTISEAIAKFPQYVTSPEIKAHCADDKKYGVVEKLVETFKARYPGKVIDVNGARVQFPNGWGLVRASSNLPELVLIFEASSKEELLKIRAIFKQILSAYPEIAETWDNDVE